MTEMDLTVISFMVAVVNHCCRLGNNNINDPHHTVVEFQKHTYHL